jgi:glycine cleavage system H protein
MKVKDDLLYTKEHEWVRIEKETATAGITEYAQNNLGDVTFVELPKINDEFEQFKPFAVVESVKAASDVYMPLSGKIKEVNGKLEESPETVNNSPYEEGWFIKFEIKDLGEKDKLMDAAQYKDYLKGLE